MSLMVAKMNGYSHKYLWISGQICICWYVGINGHSQAGDRRPAGGSRLNQKLWHHLIDNISEEVIFKRSCDFLEEGQNLFLGSRLQAKRNDCILGLLQPKLAIPFISSSNRVQPSFQVFFILI